MREFANIQIEVIVRPEICERLMQELETGFFSKYSMIAFESDIRVRRKEKFYGTLKTTLAEHVNAFNAPIIAAYHSPHNTEATVKEFLIENAKRVTPVALETVESCREAMGIGRSLYRA